MTKISIKSRNWSKLCEGVQESLWIPHQSKAMIFLIRNCTPTFFPTPIQKISTSFWKKKLNVFWFQIDFGKGFYREHAENWCPVSPARWPSPFGTNLHVGMKVLAGTQPPLFMNYTTKNIFRENNCRTPTDLNMSSQLSKLNENGPKRYHKQICRFQSGSIIGSSL